VKNAYFQPLSRNTSETVGDRTSVTTDH